jgi:hypothetical protein
VIPHPKGSKLAHNNPGTPGPQFHGVLQTLASRSDGI